jgi:hypothetical protein
MTRLWVIAAVLLLAVTVYALVDVAVIERGRVRGIPRPVWLVVVLVFPLIGAVLWFVVGRGPRPAARRGPVAPDDDPDFLRGLNTPPSPDGPANRG